MQEISKERFLEINKKVADMKKNERTNQEMREIVAQIKTPQQPQKGGQER